MPEKPPGKPPPSEDDAAPNGEIVVTNEEPISLEAVGKAVGPEKGKKESTAYPAPDAEQPPPFTRLPYTRASLRSPKDHGPKLHAHVKLRNPEEAEFVGMGPVLQKGGAGPASREAMQDQMAKTMQVIQSWQRLVSAPYDKNKPHRMPNHF